MPIDHRIDHARRIVFATARGILTAQELFNYQQEVWSDPAVAGYDELVDMSAVVRIDQPSATGVRELAETSAGMDLPTSQSRFAIFAPEDHAYGLGRMYQTHRGMIPASTKRVEVFRTMESALAWLEVKDPPAEEK